MNNILLMGSLCAYVAVVLYGLSTQDLSQDQLIVVSHVSVQSHLCSQEMSRVPWPGYLTVDDPAVTRGVIYSEVSWLWGFNYTLACTIGKSGSAKCWLFTWIRVAVCKDMESISDIYQQNRKKAGKYGYY